MKTNKISVVSALFFLLLYTLCSHAVAGQKKRTEGKNSTTERSTALVLPVQLYQTVLSKVDGSRCRMEPTCSAFCIEAIKKHGSFLGWIMCTDRLVRCGRDEEKISPTVWINGDRRIADAVKNNDFWWQGIK